MLERSVVEKSVVETCCRVVEECWRRVLQETVGEAWWRRVL